MDRVGGKGREAEEMNGTTGEGMERNSPEDVEFAASWKKSSRCL